MSIRSDYYMNLEVSSEPFRVSLSGYGGRIDNGNVPALGKRLMDRMWNEVHTHQIATSGVNHWVYLPNSMIFIGVELVDRFSDAGTLEKMEVSLKRYLKYLHVGPYATLPQIWPQLLAELEQRNEKPTFPKLEIYGHWNPEPTKCETLILLALDQGK
ncbi:MAG: hypothetical protein ABI557_03835 [Aureliella sp.]